MSSSPMSLKTVGQPGYARILTPHGFDRLANISAGDTVLSRDGRPVEVRRVHPQGVLPIYRLTFSDGATTACAADHTWAVSVKPNPEPQDTFTLDAEHLATTLGKHRGMKLHVPLPRPAQFARSLAETGKAYEHGARAVDGATIPGFVLMAPEPARLAAVHGFADAASTRRGIFLPPEHAAVAQQVQWLVNSLGGTIHFARAGQHVQLRIALPGGQHPSSRYTATAAAEPSRRVVAAVPDGEAECVRIRVAAVDNFHITDGFVVTH